MLARNRFEKVIRKFTLIYLLALAGCTSTPTGHPGGAGPGEVINGVEVWKEGHPARPYQVIATVEKQGADSSASYGDEEGLIAADARRLGADGVIVLNAVMVISRMNVVDGRPVMAPKVTAELIKYE
jgi:hypothetical protein